MVFRDSGMRRFLSIGDSTRAFNTLRNLALHDVSRWVLVGVLAVEFHCLRVENSHAIRHLNDIDFVATAFECIPETLARDFLFRHVHPFDPPCKTMMQLVDADTSLRVDVFRTNGEIMSRAILVDGPTGPIRVISVEDVVACEARLLLDLAASVPVPAKHANDYLRLADLVKSSNLETAWQDHRKPTHPMTFGETSTLLKGLIATRRNLLINLEYSKDTAEICPRCVRTSAFQLADSNCNQAISPTTKRPLPAGAFSSLAKGLSHSFQLMSSRTRAKRCLRNRRDTGFEIG